MFKTEGCDFTGAYAQAGRHEDYGNIAFPSALTSVYAAEQAQDLIDGQGTGRARQPISARRTQRTGPIAIQSAKAEKVTKQRAQYCMNELNPPDVVGSLPADKHIDMAALKPVPLGQAGRMQELVETPDEPLYLYARTFGKALVLFAKTQIVRHLG